MLVVGARVVVVAGLEKMLLSISFSKKLLPPPMLLELAALRGRERK